jgi:hypothetical protein
MDLAEIPLVDLRDGGTLHHATTGKVRALGLRTAVLGWFPRIVRPLTPQLDGIARSWLERSRSPYLEELRAIAAALGFPGIWFLNGSYQWGCTSLACEQSVPWLIRTLDWPYPGLGRYADIALMRGPAGEFISVTWAGYVGALTACAPGRFAAAVNQAPMWRRSQARALRIFDVAANAVATYSRMRDMPPDQLLRQVFETCGDYREARRVLEVTPIARPVIYTLAGCRSGECCVIERTETGSRTREHDTGAANDWIEPHPRWEARIGFSRALTSTFQEAADYSHQRRIALAAWSGELAHSRFAWLTPPVLNPYTRVGIEMCPARGIARAIGYEREPDQDLSQPVTRPREVGPERIAA